MHRYYSAGGATEFDDDEYYTLFARSERVAADVDDATAALDEFAPRSDIGVIVDEWGVWHPEAVSENGLEQANTVRDALTAASVLDDFHARADVLAMANIAQTVNVLQCLVQTDEDDAWATPTYAVFDLYGPHAGQTALRTVVETGVRTVDAGGPGRASEGEEGRDEHAVEYVSASASGGESGLYVTISNRDKDRIRDVRVSIDGDPAVSKARVLFDGRDVDECSTSDEEFAPADIDVEKTGDGEFVVEMPASSVVGISLDS